VKRATGFALAAVWTLAACSGGSGASGPVPGPAPTTPGALAAAAPAATVPYGAAALQGATLAGTPAGLALGIDVYVGMRDEPGLISYAGSVSDPHSALFRHFLTPQELGDRFGASAADYAASIRTLNGMGLQTKAFPQRQMLRVYGAQAALERFIGAKFGLYRKGTQRFLAPMTAPHVDGRIAVRSLRATIGLHRARRDLVPLRASHGLLLGYAPQQVAAAFDYTGAYAAGFTGRGITVGIVGTGPLADGDARVAGTGDVAYYRSLYGIGGGGTLRQVYGTDANVSPGNPNAVGGGYSTGLQTPPPVTSETTAACVTQGYNPAVPGANISDYTTCNPEDVEAQLDTEQIAALAPDANTNFYLAYNPTECFAAGTYQPGAACPGSTTAAPIAPVQELGLFLSDDEIQQAIGDDAVDVLSISFGGDEPTSLGLFFDATGKGFGPTEFASLASEGIAVFASTGDFGAQGCAADAPTALPAGYTVNTPCVGYPSGDPNVVAVGGVNAPIDQSGRLAGPLTTWGTQTSNAANVAASGGGGGGVSAYFAAPLYQLGIAGISGSTRNQPDIAGVADGATGMSVVYDAPFGAKGGAVGGTSIAAPQSAAMWALVLQACRQTASCATASGPHPYRLGNPSPLLYAIDGGAASGGGFVPKASYASTFYDVQYGSNATVFQPVTTPVGMASPVASATPDPLFAPGFTAGQGYDSATGLGVPFARHLIKAIVGI